MPNALSVSLIVVLMGLSGTARAADLHVDPAAPDGGTGTPDAPFASVQAAFGSGRVQDGDRLLLTPGFHGAVGISAPEYAIGVTIEGPPLARGRAWVTNLRVHAGAGLTIRRILVMPDPDGAEKPASWGPALVRVEDAAHRITLENLEVRSAPDGALVGRRRADQWVGHTWSGIDFGAGGKNVARGNLLRGVVHGIVSWGVGDVVEGNVIDGFTGDGLRGLGDSSVFRANRVRNCYKVDDNHDDGFQSWTRGSGEGGRRGSVGAGVVRGVTVSGNRIEEWSRPEDHPLRCTLQGIGLFDGFYEDWTIENNIIAVSHWHGITMLGARNGRVVNNTVINVRPEVGGGRPWIMVTAHKDGRPSFGVDVRNNIAPAYKLEGAEWGNNIVLRFPRALFSDVRGLVPNPDGRAAGAADPAWQPPTDIDGRPRPASGGDAGAIQGRP
jgi:hypothetical protein